MWRCGFAVATYYVNSCLLGLVGGIIISKKSKSLVIHLYFHFKLISQTILNLSAFHIKEVHILEIK